MKKYLPRDYTSVPWEYRPLAMKSYDRFLGQPIEEVIAMAYYQKHSVRQVAKILTLDETTLRRWMKSLSLLICANCSRDKGILHTILHQCPGCLRYLCASCYEKEEPEHFV